MHSHKSKHILLDVADAATTWSRWSERISIFVQSDVFDFIVIILIVADLLFVGYQANYVALHWVVPPMYQTVQLAFAAVFSSELLLRAIIYRSTFVLYVSRNIIDTLTIISMNLEGVIIMLQHLCDFRQPHSFLFHSTGILRLIRILRMLRVVHRLRFLEFFGHVRIIVVSIIDSMNCLTWCLILILILNYCMAVFMTSVVNDLKVTSGHRADVEAEQAELLGRFGTVTASMMCMYQVTLDGVHWGEVFDVITHSCPYLVCAVFVMYTSWIKLGVLNIIASTFVTFALKHGETDGKMIARSKAMTFFEDADLDEDGLLSWEEFVKHLQHPVMKDLLDGVEIDLVTARHIFDYADKDGSGMCSIQELISSLGNIDVNTVIDRMGVRLELKAVREDIIHLVKGFVNKPSEDYL